MDDVKNTGGASAPDAGTTPVEKIEDVKLAEVLEATSKRIGELESENVKLAEERENYRVGMLSAKDKIKILKDQGYSIDDEEKPQFNVDDVVKKVVEQLKPLITKPAESEDLKTKVSELATAVRNRSQINATGAGKGSEEVEKKNSYFSADQLADLKAKGLDPEKVKQNIQKYKENNV